MLNKTLFRGHSRTSEDIPVQNKCINQVIWYNKLAISYIEIISEVVKCQPNLKRNKTQVKILYMEKKKEFLISFTSQMAHYIRPCYFLMKWDKDLTSPRLIHWKGCSKTENTILCCSFNLRCWAFFKRINWCLNCSHLTQTQTWKLLIKMKDSFYTSLPTATQKKTISFNWQKGVFPFIH